MKLQKITQVLMCKPLFFDTLDYVINPWMKPGKINGKEALSEWNTLKQAYEKRGITVEVIEQTKGNPDMVFAADQGIVVEKTVVVSRFWHEERRQETRYYEQWFENHGYRLQQLPSGIFFEGNGDSYSWNDKLFIGMGYRANQETCRAVAKLIDREVIPIEIVDPAFYHLDVGFFPLNANTIFYYPPAFSEKSRGVLKKLVPNLREFSKNEAYAFCANSIVTDHHVVHHKGNETFTQTLKELGYASIAIDVGEFIKSGGGIHCLTNILEETYEQN